MVREIVTTYTRDCPSTCGLIAQVDQGRVMALRGNPRHALSQGSVCQKVQKFVQRSYSADRILTPLRRNRTSGEICVNLLNRDITSKVGNGASYYETKVRIERL